VTDSLATAAVADPRYKPSSLHAVPELLDRLPPRRLPTGWEMTRASRGAVLARALAQPLLGSTVLSVTVPAVERPFLVDVGFGGQTLTSRIHLEVGPVSRPVMSHIASKNTARVVDSKPRSAASGNRCISSARVHSRGSTSRSEVGMSQRIPTRRSSQV
jgi:hypothetical protein